MSVRIRSVLYLRAVVLGRGALLTYRVGISDEFLTDDVTCPISDEYVFETSQRQLR